MLRAVSTRLLIQLTFSSVVSFGSVMTWANLWNS